MEDQRSARSHSNEGTDQIASNEAIQPVGTTVTVGGDYFFSTMPVRELLSIIDTPVPIDLNAISDGLMYRDFITVGLLADRLLITGSDGGPIQDTWIDIQEPDVLLGRL